MKYALAFLSLFIGNLVFAQLPTGWDGNFNGTIIGINAMLSGKVSGATWVATINVQGYPLEVEGLIASNHCEGTITDVQAKTTSPFIGNLSGDEITITINDINPITGIQENMNFVFVRSSDNAVIDNETESTTSVEGNRDQALTGTWRRTESYVSGDFSFATDYFIEFHANGVVYVSDGRTAGGGPSSSIDSGTGDVHEGTWKTEGKTLWMNDGNSGWINYARYYVEGNAMMFTFGNGNKQVWERI